MKPPEGMELPRGSVLKLLKSWPGLRQAGPNWWRVLSGFFEKQGMQATQAEPCLFIQRQRTDAQFEDGQPTPKPALPDGMIASTYVDDVILVGRTEQCQALAKLARQRFNLRVTDLCVYLNVNVIRRGGKVMLTQQRYVEFIIVEAGLSEANSAVTPAVTKRVTVGEMDDAAVSVSEYRTLVADSCGWLSERDLISRMPCIN